MNREIDVRKVLSATRVPTLILHRTADPFIEVEHARYLARHIVGAKLIEFSGEVHLPWLGDRDAILDKVEQYLTGGRRVHEPERLLATVLFVDIVGSTERAAALGDLRWRELLETFYVRVREVLQVYRGREIRTAGDGLLAAFDGPARAIRCAGAICERVRSLGLEVRCGIHTGECERMGDDLAGIAVHIGARVAALAAPGEALVSQTVRDLVAGSDLAFEERGMHALKGVPDEWRLVPGPGITAMSTSLFAQFRKPARTADASLANFWVIRVVCFVTQVSSRPEPDLAHVGRPVGLGAVPGAPVNPAQSASSSASSPSSACAAASASTSCALSSARASSSSVIARTSSRTVVIPTCCGRRPATVRR